jgi:uncharacterized protein (DUF362 family)
LKPNLVNSSPFPVTTSPECLRPVIQYLKECTNARLILMEKILISDDPFKADQCAARLLGINPETIKHIFQT